jgi:hypothetical protein
MKIATPEKSIDNTVQALHFGCPSISTPSKHKALEIRVIMNAPKQVAMPPYSSLDGVLLAKLMAGSITIGTMSMCAMPVDKAVAVIAFTSRPTPRSSVVANRFIANSF